MKIEMKKQIFSTQELKNIEKVMQDHVKLKQTLSQPPPSKNFIMRLQGLLELSVILFFAGVIFSYTPLAMIGGILMLIDDILDISLGILNPLFPIIFALILAIIISPWYMGIFWSLAIFHILGIPHALMKIVQGYDQYPLKYREIRK